MVCIDIGGHHDSVEGGGDYDGQIDSAVKPINLPCPTQLCGCIYDSGGTGQH